MPGGARFHARIHQWIGSIELTLRDKHKKQGGSGNKWQTPAQREKLDSIKNSMLAVGDTGIWVTCQRGKEKQARGEMTRICEDVCCFSFLM